MLEKVDGLHELLTFPFANFLYFISKGNPVEETAELGEVTAHADRPGYEPISSTLWRQREDYCARLIQGAWRRRGQPIQDELFGSRLGSRSVLDAVAEEASEEDEEDDDNARKASAVAGIVIQLSSFARNFWCNMTILNTYAEI